jgi:uncharacterized membrane protein
MPRADAAVLQEPALTARARVDAVDVVRGIAMILMALDHTRDFVGDPRISPTNLAQASAALFLTRWVTHLCAPTFFLLTGVGASLMRARRPAAHLSRYLFTRGLWLLLLEAVVLRCLAWQFNVDFHLTMLTVLWALGWAMIVLAGLVHLPTAAIAAFGLVLVAGHNAFDGVRSASWWWTILHSPNVLVSGDHTVFVAYPLIPWIGVTAAGYALGGIYRWEPPRRRRFLIALGWAMAAGFLVLRTINVYGDPSRWRAQATGLFTVLSFLNTTKYPPSLLFLLMALGPALLLLAAAERGHLTAPMRVARSIGQVPLFYFAVHAALIHLVAIAICFARYGQVHWMFESDTLAAYPVTPPPGWGVPLPAVYVVWVAVVAALYPLCVWFGGVKRRRPEWWLRYL